MKYKPDKVRYSAFSFFAVGRAKRGKYENYYLGILNMWVPMPYSPTPGKGKHISPGMCIMGQCVCIPSQEKPGKCMKIEVDRGYLVAFIIIAQAFSYLIC